MSVKIETIDAELTIDKELFKLCSKLKTKFDEKFFKRKNLVKMNLHAMNKENLTYLFELIKYDAKKGSEFTCHNKIKEINQVNQIMFLIKFFDLNDKFICYLFYDACYKFTFEEFEMKTEMFVIEFILEEALMFIYPCNLNDFIETNPDLRKVYLCPSVMSAWLNFHNLKTPNGIISLLKMEALYQPEMYQFIMLIVNLFRALESDGEWSYLKEKEKSIWVNQDSDLKNSNYFCQGMYHVMNSNDTSPQIKNKSEFLEFLTSNSELLELAKFQPEDVFKLIKFQLEGQKEIKNEIKNEFLAAIYFVIISSIHHDAFDNIRVLTSKYDIENIFKDKMLVKLRDGIFKKLLENECEPNKIYLLFVNKNYISPVPFIIWTIESGEFIRLLNLINIHSLRYNLSIIMKTHPTYIKMLVDKCCGLMISTKYLEMREQVEELLHQEKTAETITSNSLAKQCFQISFYLYDIFIMCLLDEKEDDLMVYIIHKYGYYLLIDVSADGDAVSWLEYMYYGARMKGDKKMIAGLQRAREHIKF
jgi:hypothetical protein